MKANDFLIEQAILEVETVKSLRKLQERQQLNEFIPLAALAPWVVAAAGFILRTVTFTGAAWLTEQALGGFVERWRRANFVPDADFLPNNMEINLEDPRTGDRYSYRYNNGQWEHPVVRTNPDGSISPTGRWTRVPNSVDMSQVIENAARQRRWYDRFFGRRLNGLGFDWSNVSEQEMQRSVALTAMASQSQNLGQSADEIRSQYDTAVRENPRRARAARQEYLRKISSVSRMGLIVDVLTALGIAAWLYQCHELIGIYDQQLEAEEITFEVYQERVQSLKDSMKTLISTSVLNAGVAALAGATSVLLVNKLGFINRMGGIGRVITAGIITGAVGLAAFSDTFKETFISLLDAIWFLDNDGAIDRVIESYLDRLLDLLGIQDIIARTGDERSDERNNFEPSGQRPSRSNVRSLAREIWSY